MELGLLLSLRHFWPAFAWAESAPTVKGLIATDGPIDLRIERIPFESEGRKGTALTINGTVPGPLLRLREGKDAVIRVTNRLDERTSIHWHGLLVPPDMDGVPGVSFAGIKPSETFTYRFPVKQSGTYWYHSHSGGQEQLGMYGPIIIDPATPDPFTYDREYVVLLSDWTPIRPMALLAKLKSDAGYFNFQKRTLGDLITDSSRMGLGGALSNRLEWSKMRMDPTDFSDVTASTYSYLMNGIPSSPGWNGLFRKGERVRLRFIDGAAMTMFDVRIPGARMTVVQADGQNVQPFTIDEFRIAPGETYDVIVEMKEDKPYAVFAETLDRSGFALGTLTPRAGLNAPVPERRKRVARPMADMGMSMAMGGGMKMDEKGSGTSGMSGMGGADMGSMQGMGGHDMKGMKPQTSGAESEIPGSKPVMHGPDHHGPGNSTVPMELRNRMGEPGTGLGDDGRRVLVYTDLKRVVDNEDQRPPEREIELHLTGNMDRYMWSINGKKYSEDPTPIPFRYGERLRLTLVNDTMMEHPMHLHGMWMYLENGKGSRLPRKHTVIVKPAERLSVAITPDTRGDWAFHCHMLLHMEMGMFRVVRVSDAKPEGSR